MSALTQKHCQPCEGGVPCLTGDQSHELLGQLHPEWSLDADATQLVRTLQFKNYYETMAFVNAVAWIAHSEDHHPDLEVHYSRCKVRYSTHAIGGLSENDFICAAKVDTLLEQDGDG